LKSISRKGENSSDFVPGRIRGETETGQLSAQISMPETRVESTLASTKVSVMSPKYKRHSRGVARFAAGELIHRYRKDDHYADYD